MQKKWIQFTFSKLSLKQNALPDFINIMLMVSTQNKIIRLKCPRSLKNKTVNFFGQTITLPASVNQFTIIISKVDTQSHQQQIGRINVNREQIKMLTKADHHFTCQNQTLILYWAAKITNQLQQDGSDSDKTQRDLSQIDAPVIKFLRTSRKHIKNQQFSPKKQRKYSSTYDLLDQALSDSSPNKKTFNSHKTQGQLKPSPSISIIEKSKTTSKNSSIKKPKDEQKPKKYRKTNSKSKKASTFNKSTHIKYGLTQFLCASIVGAIAGYVLHSFY